MVEELIETDYPDENISLLNRELCDDLEMEMGEMVG